MEFKSQATSLYQFLSTTKKLWDDEVLDSYPESLDKFSLEWIELLWNLPIKDWHRFDNHEPLEALKETSLQNFLDQIKQLTTIAPMQLPPLIPLEDWAYTDVKFKKRHEIDRIAPLIKAINSEQSFSRVIDIGGGVGHLSRILSHYHGLNVISLDRDSSFQERGKLRLQKYRQKNPNGSLEFVALSFGDEQDEKKLASYMDQRTFTLGLHTCGPLANKVISTSIKYQNIGLLNFGCCYHKLHPQNDFNLSQFYQKHFDLKLNLYSFTLASRAHCPISFDEFQTKWQVKNYRQALHLFLYHHLNIKNCFNVGEMHVREYNRPFEEYLDLKLKELKIVHSFTLHQMKNFYESSEIQTTLKKMFICNLIRWQIGRALEVYILLDRAIYLEENGFNVQMNTYFTETISPRNIGLLALRN